MFDISCDSLFFLKKGSVQKSTALEVFYQTNSVSETIRILEYSTRRQLYTWIAAENIVKGQHKHLPCFANPSEHPRNPPLDVKLDAIRRCFKQREYKIYIRRYRL